MARPCRARKRPAELGREREFTPTVRASLRQARPALQTELRIRWIVVLAPRTFHQHPVKRGRNQLTVSTSVGHGISGNNAYLASLPARTTITFTGSAHTVKPTLHVLDISINSYVYKGWSAP